MYYHNGFPFSLSGSIEASADNSTLDYIIVMEDQKSRLVVQQILCHGVLDQVEKYCEGHKCNV